MLTANFFRNIIYGLCNSHLIVKWAVSVQLSIAFSLAEWCI